MTFTPTVQEEERRRREDSSVSKFLSSSRRVFDAESGREMVKIFSGDYYISSNSEKEIIATILGSCVSACIRDPIAQVGGMNHFLLPGNEFTVAGNSDAARYGLFAMESLINGLLKAGARKDRLEVKVFGGGNVINNSAQIGSKNAEFIRSFLRQEGFKISSEDLEGDYPRRVHYYPDTGKVMMRKLKRKEDFTVVEAEKKYSSTIAAKPVEGDIDLF